VSELSPSLATLVVRNIAEMVTCDPSRGEAPGLIRNAALAASNGRIVYAGEEGALGDVTIASDATTVDAGRRAVVPGFVDAHTHAIWLGDRAGEYALRAQGVSYEEIAALGGGIAATLRATREGSVEDLVVAARPRLRRMLEQGTTTVEIKSGYGGDVDAELRQLEAAHVLRADPELPDVVTTFLPFHALPEGDRAAFVDEVCTRWLPRIPSHVSFVDAFCDQGAYTVEECVRLFVAARQFGLRPKLHADQRDNSGGALLAAHIGAVSADHLEHATDEELRALANAGVVGVLLPGAALVLGSPPPPGRRLHEAGARYAVATDCNPGTCYSESMPLMVSLAVSLARLTPAEALVAATLGGAAALELTDRGALRAGMRCDAVILDSPYWMDVAYHLGAPVAGTVVRDGRVVGKAP
jgi:imidazolonepropionase